jgi:hypothetical protein
VVNSSRQVARRFPGHFQSGVSAPAAPPAPADDVAS